MSSDFPTYFHAATENQPYDYQRRLAEDGTCESRLISIPTGLGKTFGNRSWDS
jgi:ERCC4-related helicase